MSALTTFATNGSRHASIRARTCESRGSIAAAARTAETVVETVTTETTVTETVVTVEETAEATFESSTSIEETGTVWKKKKKD